MFHPWTSTSIALALFVVSMAPTRAATITAVDDASGSVLIDASPIGVSASGSERDAKSNRRLAQSFTVPTFSDIEASGVLIDYNKSLQRTGTFNLFSVADPLAFILSPGISLVSETVDLDAVAGEPSDGVMQVSFTTPVTLTAGQSYAVQWVDDGTSNEAFAWERGGAVLPDGARYENGIRQSDDFGFAVEGVLLNPPPFTVSALDDSVGDPSFSSALIAHDASGGRTLNELDVRSNRDLAQTFSVDTDEFPLGILAERISVQFEKDLTDSAIVKIFEVDDPEALLLSVGTELLSFSVDFGSVDVSAIDGDNNGGGVLEFALTDPLFLEGGKSYGIQFDDAGSSTTRFAWERIVGLIPGSPYQSGVNLGGSDFGFAVSGTAVSSTTVPEPPMIAFWVMAVFGALAWSIGAKHRRPVSTGS